MKRLITCFCLFTAGCGALFSDDDATIDVSAPAGAVVTLDGAPAHTGQLKVSNHETHIIEASVGGKVIGACHLHPHVVGRYAVGDALLIEMIAPIVIDVATSDWSVIGDQTCAIQ